MSKKFDKEVLAEGAYFTFTCSTLSGSQPLFFQWFKDGQIITSQSKDIQITSLGKMQSILSIENVKAIDSANYTCNAKNDFGEDIISIRLIVRGKAINLIANY